ncbi:HlyD family type I secretion periplasmic adaptor subunit [Aquincola sp. J276]|uniref:HlyD family type I secretion periplasmic adaptor subunit n=1 Tax=Aquincola sp. J276 TaxID=2898432 RepID=UPI0021507C39|nr:HlyD family type I secretion periplasmic adaptor subunit [Aquincola sp. J276]MCR5866681.1 HlyD family type I secretion periplasmic adaptor subunit [Aquincola sp. J276]
MSAGLFGAADAAAADLDAGPRRLVLVMVAMLALFGLVVLAWATWAQVDVAVNARGTVLAPSRLQEVQSLEGGIVRALNVRAGDSVHKGQPLVELDEVQAEVEVGESRESLRALQAARIRVQALLDGRAPSFGTLEADAPALVREERRLWESARHEFDANASAAAEAVRRRAAELAEAEGRIPVLEPLVASAREALQIEERLGREGAGARADLLVAQQRFLQQQAELSALRQSLPRLAAGLAEARAQAAEQSARLRAQWGAQRTEIEGKLQAMVATVRGREDKLARRVLSSPMDGVVNRVLVNTVGGVAAPGAAILEIVPRDKTLTVTVRVKPADIGFLHAGQQATLRVTSFDSSIYGTLDATVQRVGADALLDEQDKQPYFEVQLQTARDHLTHHGRQLAIGPGMPVEASILTGRRTVMQYLLKPVLKTLDSAMQER